MRRATVLATVVLALGALGAPAMAVAPDAVPDEGAASLDRLDGETRFDTAALTALRAFPDGADTVLIATGLNFPDALAASFLAGGDTQAPILLVEREHIPSETADAIETLDPSDIVVLGGDDAIATETVQQMADTFTGADVDVIGGATRIETAAMIARQGGAVGTAPNLSDPEAEDELVTAIVARAGDFPDALSSGPLALEGRHPILLTPTDSLDETTREVLTDSDLGIEQVIIAGGTVAISQDVEDAITDLDSIASVARVSGENRTATAVQLAELTRDVLGWDGSDISLARGDFFPDALTVAPLAADLDASLFLSRNPQTIEGDTFEGIQALCAETENLLITGGTDAISADAAGEAKLATICADYTFPISGEQEVADGDADAAGTGWVTVVDDTVCAAYDVEGLEDADQSHIHAGVAGTDGDPVVTLGDPNMNGFLATCADNAEVADGITAMPSAYYVNIHSPAYPQGAARGQLAEPPVELQSEFTVAGDAVLGDTGVAGLTIDATLTPNEGGQLCLTLENVSPDGAATPTAAQLFPGAVDEQAATDDTPTASFEEITVGEQVCTDVEDPASLLTQADQLYLSVDNADGDEVARGQVGATAEAVLMDADTEVGTALLYRGADATYLCALIEMADTITPAGNATVLDAEDAEIAVVDATDAADFACDEAAVDAEPETITVVVTGDTEGDGELTGDFTPDASVTT